ncbi:MAG: hypothetical protein AB8G99_09080, partial [Planctomycetaceae bacterium]
RIIPGSAHTGGMFIEGQIPNLLLNRIFSNRATFDAHAGRLSFRRHQSPTDGRSISLTLLIEQHPRVRVTYREAIMRTYRLLAPLLAALVMASQPSMAQQQENQASQRGLSKLPALPPTPAEPKATPKPILTRAPRPKTHLGVNDYKRTWHQAGSGQEGLGDRLRSHVVRIDEDGLVKGKIGTIEAATGDLEAVEAIRIRFIRKGEEIAQAGPDATGMFSVDGLEPGVYSMVAAGAGGFIACSVNIQPKLSDIAKMPKYKQARFLKQEVNKRIEIESAAVAPNNFIPLKELLRNYMPTEESAIFLDGPEIPEGMEDVSPENARLGTPIRHHQIRLTRDGKLRGRVRRLQPDSGRDLKIRQLNVFLLRNNSNIAQEEVAPNGTFAFSDLRPGVYSLVAAGKDGFVAFSIDVLKPRRLPEDELTDTETVRTASMRIDDGAQTELAIDVALCSTEDLNAANVDKMTDNFPRDGNASPVADAGAGAPPQAGPGAMPGLPSGVSPIGGGGGIPPSSPGLGSILTSTAVGVAVGSVLDDDDDKKQSSPSSPGGGSGP